jgi:hypothetical protein
MIDKAWRSLVTILVLLIGVGCGKPIRQETPVGAPSFVNRVWMVAESNTVTKGTLYVFLSEGTLVVASPHGKPALGSWRYEGDRLVAVEESIEYPVDILHLDDREFRIRSNNPGTPVEIKLILADLPAAP